MDLVPSTHKASKVALEDVINSMPDNVVTNILDCLPIQYAVRTAILSRNWRFKWTMLTHLVFDEMFYEYLVGLGIGNWYEVKNIISRLLLLHLNGPITKFVLYIPNGKVFDVEDINNWIMFLSRNGVEEFTLKNMHVTPLKLSTHILSCVGLKSLTIWECSLLSPPTLCGLPNLLELELYEATFENISVGEFITQSPSLEVLILWYYPDIGKMKLVEIAKLENLYYLYLPLHLLDDIPITTSLIVDLGNYLPYLEVLSLDFQKCQFLGDSVAKKRVSTSFPCLESLTLRLIDFSSELHLSFAYELIWHSPQLQTLWITAKHNDVVPPPANFSSDLNSTQLGLAQLQNVELKYFQGSENEIWLIKTLLAGSPLLEKIDIHPKSSQVGSDNQKLMVASKLLKFHRASPNAEVEIYWS